jgi:Protein of unknown function DUF262
VASNHELTGMPPQGCPLDEQGYGYHVVTVGEAVERAVSGEWDVPEFQRQFVWRASQACDLADSLWQNYPIGSLLLWRDANHVGDARSSGWWIADGQQRLTSLCMLYGREPAWLRRKPADYRRRLLQRFDFGFDLGGKSSPGFVVASTATAARDPRLVSVRKLTAMDPCTEPGRTELEQLTTELKSSQHYRELERAEIYHRLMRVSIIRERQLVVTLVRYERETVLEIFERLNSRGMRFRRLLLKLAMEEIPAAIRQLHLRR